MVTNNSVNNTTTGITGYTGTAWTGTPVTNHAVIIGGSTSSALSNVGPTATAGQYLQSSGSSADPVFSTATLPATATGTGTLLRADGTNWVATTSTYPNTNAVSTLLYASSSNVMAALSTANNGMLVTSATGVPSILAGPGTTGNILQSNAAAAPSFSTSTFPSVATGTGTLLRADGTNWVATTSTYPNTNAVSTLLYASSANVMSALATANTAILATDGSGVPSLTTTPTTTSLTLTGSGLTPLSLVSTDAGAGAGPIIDIYRNSASPAAADVLGSLPFQGVDSGSAKQEYARIEGRIISTTASSEKGALDFYTTASGTSTKQIALLDTGGQYRGNNTNTVAPAGFMGEIISSVLIISTPITLTTATAKTVTSILLTPGNWLMTGTVGFFGATTVSSVTAGISQNNNSYTGTVDAVTSNNGFNNTSTNNGYAHIIPVNVTLSANTTWYLIASSSFTVGTQTAWGSILAVRIG